ncbi:MAG: hypothetical protein IPI67_38635 [Myxococcales bacterium]|nr:hypothetical protein [Myxococcales bacterium]
MLREPIEVLLEPGQVVLVAPGGPHQRRAERVETPLIVRQRATVELHLTGAFPNYACAASRRRASAAGPASRAASAAGGTGGTGGTGGGCSTCSEVYKGTAAPATLCASSKTLYTQYATCLCKDCPSACTTDYCTAPGTKPLSACTPSACGEFCFSEGQTCQGDKPAATGGTGGTGGTSTGGTGTGGTGTGGTGGTGTGGTGGGTGACCTLSDFLAGKGLTNPGSAACQVDFQSVLACACFGPCNPGCTAGWTGCQAGATGAGLPAPPACKACLESLPCPGYKVCP